jgi:hypothetical protein
MQAGDGVFMSGVGGLPGGAGGWKMFEAWCSTRAAAAQKSLSESADMASNLMSAWTNKINGQAQLITKMATKRLTAELQQKIAQTQKSLGVDKKA